MAFASQPMGMRASRSARGVLAQVGAHTPAFQAPGHLPSIPPLVALDGPCLDPSGMILDPPAHGIPDGLQFGLQSEGKWTQLKKWTQLRTTQTVL
jgi:hypothetical protein